MGIEFAFPQPRKKKKITPITEKIDPICPYCHNVLKKIPQKKTKCPHCGEFMYFKYRPSDPVKRIITESENDAIQKEWEEHYIRENVLDRLYEFGIKEEEFILRKHQLKINSSLCDDMEVGIVLLKEAANKSTNHHTIKMIYFTIALMLHQSEQSSKKMQELSMHHSLLKIKQDNIVSRVKILGGGISCECCKKLDGQIFEIDYLLTNPVLPNPNCNHDINKSGDAWCRCEYLPDLDEALSKFNIQ